MYTHLVSAGVLTRVQTEHVGPVLLLAKCVNTEVSRRAPHLQTQCETTDNYNIIIITKKSIYLSTYYNIGKFSSVSCPLTIFRRIKSHLKQRRLHIK